MDGKMTGTYVFDAYGTLFDVHSAVARHAQLVSPQSARVSEIWRNKQLEYSWTLTLMGRYRPFWDLTEAALDFALAAVPGANAEAREALLDAYRTLSCYPEVPQVLKQLKEGGARTAIFSNGSPEMLDSAVSSSGIGDYLDKVISIHDLGKFKTHPESYRLVTDAFGITPKEVTFQSSNRWDIAGAAAFGFTCNWVNRTGQPDEYGDLSPTRILENLNGLP